MRAAVFGILIVTAGAPAAAQAPSEVRLRVADDLVIVGDLYRTAAPADSPAILLFHQGGGDARGEYGAIIPRLLREKFHVLSVDVRGGGSRFGGTHRVPQHSDFRYCQAFTDVEAALSLARAHGLTGPIILWGSSYTATLAIQLAARRPADVAAVLAFSPAAGEPLIECPAHTFAPWITRAGNAFMLLRASAEIADADRRDRHERLAALATRTFVANGSGHASSILDASRFEGDVEPQWHAVLAFLKGVTAPRTTYPPAQAVTVENSGWLLHGDLVMPPGPAAPLVLLLSGGRGAYAALANHLAAAGIASMRLDVRGEGGSTNRGRFIPYVSRVEGAEHDVMAALAYVRTLPGVDTARIAVVSGSAGGEAVALAIRGGARVRAVAALSPGSFSDESFAALDATTASWLFARSDDERFVREWLDEKVRAHSRRAELWVIPAGSAHATTLLLADPAFPAKLAEWLRMRLH